MSSVLVLVVYGRYVMNFCTDMGIYFLYFLSCRVLCQYILCMKLNLSIRFIRGWPYVNVCLLLMHENKYIKRHGRKHDLKTCEEMPAWYAQVKTWKVQQKWIIEAWLVFHNDSRVRKHVNMHPVIMSILYVNALACLRVYEFLCMWSVSSQLG